MSNLTSHTICWTTDEPSTAQIEYSNVLTPATYASIVAMANNPSAQEPVTYYASHSLTEAGSAGALIFQSVVSPASQQAFYPLGESLATVSGVIRAQAYNMLGRRPLNLYRRVKLKPGVLIAANWSVASPEISSTKIQWRPGIDSLIEHTSTYDLVDLYVESRFSTTTAILASGELVAGWYYDDETLYVSVKMYDLTSSIYFDTSLKLIMDWQSGPGRLKAIVPNNSFTTTCKWRITFLDAVGEYTVESITDPKITQDGNVASDCTVYNARNEQLFIIESSAWNRQAVRTEYDVLGGEHTYSSSNAIWGGPISGDVYEFYTISAELMGSAKTSVQSELQTSHRVVLSSLVSATTYYYHIITADRYANATISGVFSFITQSLQGAAPVILDTQAQPTQIPGLPQILFPANGTVVKGISVPFVIKTSLSQTSSMPSYQIDIYDCDWLGLSDLGSSSDVTMFQAMNSTDANVIAWLLAGRVAYLDSALAIGDWTLGTESSVHIGKYKWTALTDLLREHTNATKPKAYYARARIYDITTELYSQYQVVRFILQSTPTATLRSFSQEGDGSGLVRIGFDLI